MTFIRYRNRKFYFPLSRSYVNLSQILVYVRQGYDVEVLDHVTKTDITTETLLSALIHERKTSKASVLHMVRSAQLGESVYV
jgi:polyhydroxyalkanoate synthesis regulator protein